MSKENSVSATDKGIQLHDERMLGYAERGFPGGKALFYFHRYPGSRLEARFLAGQAEKMVNHREAIVRPLSILKRG